MKIPRAVYYMDFFEPLLSIIRWPFRKLKYNNQAVTHFEKSFQNYFNYPNVVAMPHARISLYFCLKSYPFEEFDEVLMTPINLPDMVNAIRSLGLKERFVDIKKEDYSIDLVDTKKKLTAKSKFLFVTHLNGIVPNMEAIATFAKEHNLILIQDCTQNIGCIYNHKSLESYSDLSFMALCDLKVIHTHMGGMIVANSEKQFKIVKNLIKKGLKPLKFKYFFRFIVEDLIANILLNRLFFSFVIFPIMRLMTKVFGQEQIQGLTKGEGLKVGHIIIFKGLFGGGGNLLKKELAEDMFYKYSSIQAKIGQKRLLGLKQIEHKRISHANTFLQNLDIPQRFLPAYQLKQGNAFWKFPIIIPRYEDLQKYLLNFGIDSARSNLPCLSELPEFKSDDQTPNASILVNSSLYIPLHYYLSKKEVIEMANTVSNFFK